MKKFLSWLIFHHNIFAKKKKNESKYYSSLSRGIEKWKMDHLETVEHLFREIIIVVLKYCIILSQ